MNNNDNIRTDVLNQGVLETKNLMEVLRVDFHLLLRHVVPNLVLPEFPEKIGITWKMLFVGACIYEQTGLHHVSVFQNHPSDTVRSLACYVIACHSFSLAEKLDALKPFANDAHFNVREWAWIAVRPDVVLNPWEVIDLLMPWAYHDSGRMRRFASELTRPMGVWCAHIKSLRKEPLSALPILDALKNDSEKYVQLSVGNWLNDAGKDHPLWVLELCERWRSESPSLNTDKICKRALRRLKG